MTDLSSDATAGMAPDVLVALGAVNAGAARSYGQDEWSERALRKLGEVFEARTTGFLVANGTAANALALAQLTPRWGTVLAHERAHVAVAECNAPEFFSGGAKVVGLPGADGKIDADALRDWLKASTSGAPGRPRPSVLSLTQCTDLGGVYTPDELTTLCAIAHASGLRVHMDGARFATAVAATGAAPADLTWRAGVDVLSLGSSKGGTMNAEAIVFFDADDADDFPLRLRQAGHTIAKGRYLGAQLLAWLDEGRWLTLAAHANHLAAAVAAALVARGATLLRPASANMIFANLPEPLAADLARRAVRYAGPPHHARFVTSWATTQADVAAIGSDA